MFEKIYDLNMPYYLIQSNINICYANWNSLYLFINIFNSYIDSSDLQFDN